MKDYLCLIQYKGAGERDREGGRGEEYAHKHTHTDAYICSYLFIYID